MNLYLNLEVLKRELDSKLLLSVLAANRGHQVLVSNSFEILFGLKKKILFPGIFHTKSLTPSKKKIFTHQEILNMGSLITSIDEEGGFLTNKQKDFVKKRFSARSIAQATAVFGWGSETAILKKCFPRYSFKIHKTGSPRIDLNKDLFTNFHKKPNSIPKKPFLLVSSNFSSNYNQQFYEVLKTSRLLGFYDRNPELFEIEFKNMSEEYLMVYSFIEAIKCLSKNTKFEIVFRPHPREPLEAWQEFLRGIPRVSVIKDGSITPWLKNAFALMHNGCSTAIEATVSNLPVVSYVPFNRKHFKNEFSNKLGYKVDNIKGLINITNLLFRNNIKKLKNPRLKYSHKILSQRIFIDAKELSANKIIKVWEKLDNNNLSKLNNWTKFYLFLKLISLKETIKKILSFFFFTKLKTYNVNDKFPPLDNKEIKYKIKKLCDLIKLNREIDVKILSNRTILIKQR